MWRLAFTSIISTFFCHGCPLTGQYFYNRVRNLPFSTTKDMPCHSGQAARSWWPAKWDQMTDVEQASPPNYWMCEQPHSSWPLKQWRTRCKYIFFEKIKRKAWQHTINSYQSKSIHTRIWTCCHHKSFLYHPWLHLGPNLFPWPIFATQSEKEKHSFIENADNKT